MSSSARPDSPPAGEPARDFAYAGSELALFAHADRWKSYFSAALAPYVLGDVLEVGAGMGGTTKRLCDGRQRSWTALEPDAELAAQLRAELRARPLPIEVAVITGALADLAPQSAFDTILYIDVLEHIERDADELERAAKHLRPGGHLVVLSPAHQSLYTAFDRAIGHFRRYEKGSLRAVAPRALRERAVFYLDAAGMLASLGNRLLLKSSMPTPGQLRFWDSVLVPLSRWVVDPLLLRRVGKTVVGVWQCPEGSTA
jgi:SAM-dependent methyltransferase